MPTVTFNYTGADQQWVVPSNVTNAKVSVELWGAAGGTGNGYDANADQTTFTPGGKGGRVIGDLAVAAGDTLHIYVGGRGQDNITSDSGTASPASIGGFNGGGNGGTDRWQGGHAASGGGASDIRKGGTALANRVAVAGGGGATGTGYGLVGTASAGGAGGGLTGAAASQGARGGKGGTQAAGGAAGTAVAPATTDGAPGTLGQAGLGNGSSSITLPGAGGGGGYYGGGGGGNTGSDAHGGGGGGGGSSYVGGLTGVITNTQGYASATGAGKVVITYTLSPNVPTLASPANGVNVDVALPLTVSWVFSDPDPGDVQSKADFRWRTGAGAWTTVASASANATTAYTAAANAFATALNQSVEWQVQTYDSAGHPSGWSPSSFFTPRTAPSAFVFNPVPTLTSNTPRIDGARGGAPIAAYQIQVLNDVGGAPGATVQVDSGVITTPTNPTVISTFAPNFAYVNGTTYHIMMRAQYPAGVWQAAWTDSGPLIANVNAPLAPSLALTPFAESYSVEVDITNPGSDPHAPSYNNLYRTDESTGIEELIQTGLALNTSYTDWTVGLNRSYRYRVEAVTAGGAVTSSA
jgi:hypothetical protein